MTVITLQLQSTYTRSYNISCVQNELKIKYSYTIAATLHTGKLELSFITKKSSRSWLTVIHKVSLIAQSAVRRGVLAGRVWANFGHTTHQTNHKCTYYSMFTSLSLLCELPLIKPFVLEFGLKVDVWKPVSKTYNCKPQSIIIKRCTNGLLIVNISNLLGKCSMVDVILYSAGVLYNHSPRWGIPW